MKELVQTRSKAIEYGIDNDYDFVDVYDFMVKIDNSNLPDNIKTAIESLWDAINSHLIYNGKDEELVFVASESEVNAESIAENEEPESDAGETT